MMRCARCGYYDNDLCEECERCEECCRCDDLQEDEWTPSELGEEE